MSDDPDAAADPRSVPDGFDAWAADREDARFTEWLRARSEPAWTEATTHRFTDELAAGVLPDAVFRRYLRQDRVFLRALVSVAGTAISEAPTVDAAGSLSSFLATVTGDENDYFERSFRALGVPADERDPTPAPATRRLTDLLFRGAQRGDYAETLAVLLPVEWVYLVWADRVADRPERFYLAEWIDLHDNPAFASFVTDLRDDLDRRGPALSSRRRRQVERLFRRTVATEAAFFEMAYGADEDVGGDPTAGTVAGGER